MSRSKPDNSILIHGPRPSPLHINKQSHLIHKLSSSYTSSSSTSVLAPAVGGGGKQQQQQRNHPLIIYTHSPKVIHTHARDFMALVQKLTGLSSTRDEEIVQLQSTQQNQDPGVTNYNGLKPVGVDGNNKYSYSVSTDDDNGGGGASNPYFADIPLFTPTSVDFICSPRPVYGSSPSMGSSISPSALEFIKGLPEY